jgi:RNA polymerase sigma factor (sigma-70 family)
MSGPARLRGRSDNALRAMAARGDAEAFGTLYERHRHALYRCCLSILSHRDDARDALHNAMAKAWAAIQRAEPDAPLRPWLFRIAHNEALNLLRDRRDHGHLEDGDVRSAESFDETIDLRQRIAALRADLAALPQRQRSALLLRELCGLRHTEIAVVLAITPAAARQTIYEARVGLHEAEAGRQMACAAVQRALSDGDGSVRRRRRIRGHLRACPACSSFDAALRRRPSELAALVGPLPASPVGLLARLLSQVGASGGTSAITKLGSGLVTNLAVGSVVVTVGTVTTLESSVSAEPIVRAPAVSAAAADLGDAARPYLRAEPVGGADRRAPEHAAPAPQRAEAPAAPAPEAVQRPTETPTATTAAGDATAAEPAVVTVEADAHAAPAKPVAPAPAASRPAPAPPAAAPTVGGGEPQPARPVVAVRPAVEAEPGAQPVERRDRAPGNDAQPDRTTRNDAQPDRTTRNDAQPDRTTRNDAQPEHAPRTDAPADRTPRDDPQPDHAPRTDPQPDRTRRDDPQPDHAPRTDAPADRAPRNDPQPDRTRRDDAQPDHAPRTDAPADRAPRNDPLPASDPRPDRSPQSDPPAEERSADRPADPAGPDADRTAPADTDGSAPTPARDSAPSPRSAESGRP